MKMDLNRIVIESIKGTLAAFGLYYIYTSGVYNFSKINEKYVNPKNLEFKLEDFDLDGRKEVMLEYKTEKGLTKYFVEKKGDNEIVLKSFEVKY